MGDIIILAIIFLIVVFFGKLVKGFFDGIFGFIKMIFTGAGCLGSIFGYIIAIIVIIFILTSLF
jgi:hypothetical protein